LCHLFTKGERTKFGVLRKEFDKLKELFYEWQAREREDQQYRKDERQKRRTIYTKLLKASVGKKRGLKD